MRVAWLVLAVLGYALVLWARWTLHLAGVNEMAPIPPQALTRCGPYRWLKHPLYAGTVIYLSCLAGWAGGFLLALCIFELSTMVFREWAAREGWR